MKNIIISSILLVLSIVGIFCLGYFSYHPEKENIIVPSYNYVSIVKEKKECDDKGGKFVIYNGRQAWSGYRSKDLDFIYLTCNKEIFEGNKTINEKIFDYKLEY